MKKLFFVLLAVFVALFSLTACTQSGNPSGGGSKQNALGAMTPADALEYMKTAENLVIVDVATTNHYNSKHFEGAIHIPIEELSGEEENARYAEIPGGRPVLLHCRAGAIVPGAYRRVLELRPDIPEISYIAGAPMFDEYDEWKQNQSEIEGERLLGGLSPADALEYMKNTPDLIIVQVNTAEWKITPGFTGALWIPHDEIAERYNEIPTDKPVILHCGGGIVSVPAYNTLIEKRPDIPQLSYIAGSPRSIINAYNEWLASRQAR